MTDATGKHVAIVGGGLAGLAAAAYLAREGHRVTVFERSEGLGGRAATTERAGYFHNMGPHALYRGGTAEEVLQELGIRYTGNTPNVDGVAVRKGRTFTLPASARSMLTTRLFGVRARVETGRQMLALRKPHAQDGRTVSEWLRDDIAEPSAREYIEAVIRLATYSNAPGVISLADAAVQFSGAASRGVIYLDGGWQVLVAGLEEAAVAHGASIRRGARVEAVDMPGATVQGLRLADGERVAADAVILAVPPDIAAGRAGGHGTLARAAAEAVPAKAACLDIGLTRLPIPRRTFGLGVDGPYYFSVHSRWAELAPQGRVMASVAKYTPAGEPHDAARDLAELEAFLYIVQPGWRQFEEHRQYLPNMVVSSALPKASTGGLAGRAGPTVAGAEGLFVAGDWVGDTGWLTDGTLGSARTAANAVSGWLAATPSLAMAAVS